MNFQRIYVDSRDREVGGTASEFDYMLSNNIVVPEESIAVLDSVLLPNSWYSVEKNLSDLLYIRETVNEADVYRVVSVEQGYYDADSLSTAVATAISTGRLVSSPYTGSFNPVTGRIELANVFTGGGALHIATEEALQTLDLSLWPGTHSRRQLMGCFRQLGISKGPVVSFTSGTLPMPQVPNLQNHSQVFIKGNLGIPGLVQGPRGGQDILRRVVVTAPQLALNYDAAGTHYDNIRVAPGTISCLHFKLCAYDGTLLELQGAEWSFSIVIYPQD